MLRVSRLRLSTITRAIFKSSIVALTASATCGWLGMAQTAPHGMLLPFVPVRADALGASSIDAMIQSSDGHLWITDGRNLLRFDGLTAVRFNPSNTPGMQVEGGFVFSALAQDRSGDIWAGTDSSGVVHVHNGKFETLGERQGLPANRVNRVDLDPEGRVWIYTSGGLARVDNGRIIKVSIEKGGEPLIADPEAIGIDGRLQGFWRRTSSGVELFSHGRWKAFPLPMVAAEPAKLRIRAIYEDRLDRVWFSLLTTPERYFCIDHGRLLQYDGLPYGSFVSYRDSNGYLWLNDHRGRAAIWKDGKTTPLPDFESTNLLHVLERSDGGFWVGTIGSKLFELRPKRFSFLPTPGAPTFNPVFFREKEGNVWVGDVRLQRWNGRGLEPVGVPDTTPRKGAELDKQIRAFGEDAQGNLLMATNYSVEKLAGGKRIPDARFGSVHTRIRSIVTAIDGTVWLGTTRGLYQYSERSLQPLSVQEGLPSNQITALQIDRRAQLWVGTSLGAALLQGSGKNASLVTAFGDRAVRAFAEDDDGAMWIAYAGGTLTRVDQNRRVQSFATADGLPNEELGDIRTDDPGYLWLTYQTQLIRVVKHALLDRIQGAPVPFQSFDTLDGLPPDLASSGTLRHLRLEDGTLWFSAGAGIASIRPSPLLGYVDHPHATVEEVLIDGVRSASSHSIGLNANYESLRVIFGAPGVTQPEKIRFRFRLKGYDQTWTKAEQDRTAFYSHLPAGSYTMEVEATAIGADNWETIPATLPIVVTAPWYARKVSRILFTVLCGAFLIAVAVQRRRRLLQSAAVRRAYTRRLTASQELERKKLAGELHDSLGQQLVIIRSIAMQPAEDDAAKSSRLNAISAQAAEAIHELEAISYSLRPYQLDRLGLTKALDALICLYRDSSAISVLHHVEDVDNCLPQHLQIDLYRIVQESMNNALRHSGATEIQVRIWADEDLLHGVIVDNGIGFVNNGLDRVGLGLSGIEERAESAGGTAEIVSTVGVGTKITIRINLEKNS